MPWARGAGLRVSPGAGISAMRGWLVALPKPSYKQRVFAPLFLAPCLCSAPSVLPALLRSASCFSFPSEQRCYSSPERVISIGAERSCAWLRAGAAGLQAAWQGAAKGSGSPPCQPGDQRGTRGECRECRRTSPGSGSRAGGARSHSVPGAITRNEQLSCYRL